MDFDDVAVPALDFDGAIDVLQLKRAARLQRIDWLKSLLFAKDGAAEAAAKTRMYDTAERKTGRSLMFYPLRVHRTNSCS